ncbi:hypothetical protein KFU94_38165 [Chloroflexi bacterium TSY]|nr:hypothetical protein [Chloroflexi bacterium TSY]
MIYWEWEIPDVYKEYIDELIKQEGLTLVDNLLEITELEDGVPREGATQTILDVYIWETAGHKVLYERIVDARILYLVSIERIR